MMISTLFNSIRRFSLLALGILLMTLGLETVRAEDLTSTHTARLVLFVETEPYHSFLGETYGKYFYQTPEVECWLDDEKLYQGLVHKPGTITKIYDGLLVPGEHRLRVRWQAPIRPLEGYKVNQGTSQKVIYIPEEGFVEEPLTLNAGEAKSILVTAWRHFGSDVKSGIRFEEVKPASAQAPAEGDR